MALDDYYDFRSRLVEVVRQDLLGPSEETELITDPPITKYVTGVLFPADAAVIDPSQDIDDGDAAGTESEDSGAWDPPVSMASVRYPSSMGMTFAVDSGAASNIQIQITAARYEPEEQSDALQAEEGDGPQSDVGADHVGDTPANVGRRGILKPLPPWRRIPVAPTPLQIDITKPMPGEYTPLAPGLELFWRVRPPDAQGSCSVTVILLNTKSGRTARGRDELCFFQPVIEVSSPEASTAAFVHRPGIRTFGADEDLRSYQLLYRHALSMAVGHGCSVSWDPDPRNPTRAVRVATEVIPSYELRLADTNTSIPTHVLGLKRLAQGSRADTLTELRRFCDAYAGWIATTRKSASELDTTFVDIAAEHLQRCDEAVIRMRGGIDVLETDSDAWEAFRLANHAMLMQRTRSDWLAGGAPGGGTDDGSDQAWRPFQLAFVLLCLRGIADPTSDDRDLTDLLWFPTGGGKTEAYLGLLAFTIALRRLRRRDAGHGVTVIMRYTLRLLTTQQFERASLLICCLEALRRRDNRLGSQPIEIGLWVGRKAAPNDLDEARIAIDKLRVGAVVHEGNPLQLQACPWCGTQIGPKNLSIAATKPRLVMACRNDGCEFADELPVRVVDQDIYGLHPTLLIATVDKFASMPWKEDCRCLFNLDLDDALPPELIIQDELHLISGPLGTMTGLYETAVDLLSTRGGIRPKVIASTATIRRANEQSSGLFQRGVRQFPPPGIDARDSYFAVEAPPDEKGTRLYIGLLAPGTSHTTLLVRTYAALLQGAHDVDGPDPVRDAYWTLVGYFNSLRVLGGARMQVQDDVNDRLELLARNAGTERRGIEERIELTSREPSGEIPAHLRRMDVAYPSPETLDVILATNMISVGVDINRLALMAVMGQPQSTSEYIQATSRVGRRWPGLVWTLFNAGKSRDRSHYESFPDFHSALYRQVESSSVTPYSARARNRGLHAVFIALVRLTIDELRPNTAAAQVGNFVDRLEPIKDAIVIRALGVEPEEAENVARELEQIVADWLLRAEIEPGLVYSNPKHPERSLLGDAALAGEDFLSVFPTLWSLRDVDQSSNLYQVT